MQTQGQGGFYLFIFVWGVEGWGWWGEEWVALRLPHRDRKVLKARGSISPPDAPYLHLWLYTILAW